MPYQRLARHVLEEWRAIERRLLLLDPTQPEYEELLAEAHRLREEHQHLIDQAVAHNRPEPPPFPEAVRLEPDGADGLLDGPIRPGHDRQEGSIAWECAEKTLPRLPSGSPQAACEEALARALG